MNIEQSFGYKSMSSKISFQDPDGRLWCSTKVSKNDCQHVGEGSYWGYCDIVNGKCTVETKDERTKVLLDVLDEIKTQQQEVLDNHRNVNDKLKSILAQLD